MATATMCRAAEVLKPVLNPWTQEPDYVNRLSSMTIGDLGFITQVLKDNALQGSATWFNFAGNGVQVSCNGGTCTITINGGGGGGAGGPLAIWDGVNIVSVSTFATPDFLVISDGQGFSSFTVRNVTGPWTASQTFHDSTTFENWVNLSSGTYSRVLIVGASDYSNGTTGFYLIAPEAGDNSSSATPPWKFITDGDSSLSAGIVHVRSSYTIQGLLDATAPQTLRTMRLAFKNVDNTDILSLTQNGGIAIKNTLAAGTDTNLLAIGRSGSTMTVTQAGLVTIGAITYQTHNSTTDSQILTLLTAGTTVLSQADFIQHTTTAGTDNVNFKAWFSTNATVNDNQNSSITVLSNNINISTATLVPKSEWTLTKSTGDPRSQQIGIDSGTIRAIVDALSVSTTSLGLSTTVIVNQDASDISNRSYFLHRESTGLASTYRLLGSSPSVDAEFSQAVNVTVGAGLVMISSHITDSGDPGIRKISAGVWEFATWVQAASLANSSQFVISVSTIALDGTGQGEIATSTSSSFLDTGVDRFDMVALQNQDVTISTSDRILVRYFGRSNSILGIIQTLYYQGQTRFTHLSAPLGAVIKSVQLSDMPQTLLSKGGKYLAVNDDQTSYVLVSTIADNLTTHISNWVLATSTNNTDHASFKAWFSTNATVNDTQNSTITAIVASTANVQQLLSTMTVVFLDEGSPQSGGQIKAINCVGGGIACSQSNGTGTITVGTFGDNLGSHIATQPVTMAFGLTASSGIVVSSLNVMGVTTSSTGFQGASATFTYTAIGDRPVPGGFSAGLVVSTILWTNMNDGMPRKQYGPAFEFITSSVPDIALSTITVFVSTLSVGYMIFEGTPSAGTGGGIFIRFNGNTSAIYAISRTTTSVNNSNGTVNVRTSSLSAVGLDVFGPGSSTNTWRSVRLTIDGNDMTGPKFGKVTGTSIDSCTIMPVTVDADWFWMNSNQQITSISVGFMRTNQPFAGAGKWLQGARIHVYGRRED